MHVPDAMPPNVRRLPAARRGAPPVLHAGAARRLYVVGQVGLTVVLDADRLELDDVGDQLRPLLIETEACAWLGVDAAVLWSMIRAGYVRAYQLPCDGAGGSLRVDQDATLVLLCPTLAIRSSSADVAQDLLGSAANDGHHPAAAAGSELPTGPEGSAHV